MHTQSDRALYLFSAYRARSNSPLTAVAAAFGMDEYFLTLGVGVSADKVANRPFDCVLIRFHACQTEWRRFSDVITTFFAAFSFFGDQKSTYSRENQSLCALFSFLKQKPFLLCTLFTLFQV
jgi:hypothetical protein